ncbi:hypothetical protein BX600DRAFT_471198 [Xylariales sp. PMI_506]|nr:hypothetical protein BX600DRAFT_471198 [Xylariales sp. PMI_506]
MAYHVAVAAIHRPFLSESSSASSSLALDVTQASAAEIAKIIRVYRKAYKFSEAPPFVVYHLLRGTLAHLLAVLAIKVAENKRSTLGLKSCLDALKEMAVVWPTRMAEVIHLIRELSYRWKMTWALPMHLSNPISDIPSVQYCYYALLGNR